MISIIESIAKFKAEIYKIKTDTQNVMEEMNCFHSCDNYGKTMIFYCENKQLIRYLMSEHNLEISALNLDGKTTSHYSRYYIEICDINIAQTDKYNRNLTDTAVEYLNVTQVSSLMSKTYKQMNHRHTIYKIGLKKTEDTASLDMSSLQCDNELIEVINIKTWLCTNEKLIDSLFELFEFDHNVSNVMSAINETVNIHNLNYIIQSMKFVKNKMKLFEFGMRISSLRDEMNENHSESFIISNQLKDTSSNLNKSYEQIEQLQRHENSTNELYLLPNNESTIKYIMSDENYKILIADLTVEITQIKKGMTELRQANELCATFNVFAEPNDDDDDDMLVENQGSIHSLKNIVEITLLNKQCINPQKLTSILDINLYMIKGG